MDDTTILVKTFERPDCLKQLLDSLEMAAPGCPVIVADDGEIPSGAVCQGRPDVTYLPMPFDQGLSAGRNFLVEHTDTEYCVILDDDFVMEDADTLEHLVSQLELDYDIVGGRLKLTNGRLQHYEGWMHQEGRVLYMIRLTSEGPTVPMQIVLNFLAARTQALRDVRWDDELKVCEHEEYFWRARAHGVRVGYTPRSTARHLRDTGSGRYRIFRNRIGEMRAKALAKHNWERTEWITV